MDNNIAYAIAHAISVHYRDFEHAYVYWIWLRSSASYVIIKFYLTITCHMFTIFVYFWHSFYYFFE